MGWEPKTVYEYDADGRMISSVREPEWDETEQLWMLALQDYRDSICPLCGWPTKICQNPALANNLKATLPVRCNVATVIDVAQATEKAQYGALAQSPHARLWGVELQAHLANSGQ